MHFEKRGSTSIRVAENDKYRWMAINDAVQSIMSLQQKEAPVLPHLSAMLMALYYQPAPQRILELGLGGGSMQRFFAHYFPDTEILTVDYDDSVIRLFKDWFSPENKVANVRQQDAREALLQASHQDMVIVDLFSQSGSPDFLNEMAFYERCLSAMTENGLLVINLIVQYQLQVNFVLDTLNELGLRVSFLSIPGFQNRILIACRTKAPKLRYDKRLEALAQKYNLDLNGVVAN